MVVAPKTACRFSMTDAMLQSRYCVAVLQHRLSYNGSIATSPLRGTRDETKTDDTITPAPRRPIRARIPTGGDHGRWPGQRGPLGRRLREQLTQCLASHDTDHRVGYLQCRDRRGDPPELGNGIGIPIGEPLHRQLQRGLRRVHA